MTTLVPRLIPFLILLAVQGCLTGCSLPANPRTEFGFDPWSRTWRFHDSKDNDIELEGVEVDRSAGTLKLQKMTIRNNASDVRRANVEQIQAYTEQVRAVTTMFQQMTATLASIVPYAKPATSTSVNIPGIGGVTRESTPILPPATQPSP